MDFQKQQIDSALVAFKNQKLVGLPTETVYGLAAPINDQELLKKIFILKKRPFFDPLIVHVANVLQAQSVVEVWPQMASDLAQHFWPGPLTIVLPKKKFISDLITASLPTVGIRCPNHPMALGLIEKLGIPLAAPSANLFKKTSPTSAAHVRDIFSTDDVYVMEGGDCQIGIESTIVFIAENAENAEKNSWSVLRPGIITVSELTKVLKKKPQEDTLNSAHQVLAPGQMIDHYQPDKPLYLKNSNDTLEHFCQMHGIQSPIIINLPNDPLITARVLYSEWRKAVSRPGDALICSLPSNWQSDERWLAIWDRIKKASKKS